MVDGSTVSSRRRAQEWPYPRHRRFEETLRKAAAAWFAERGYRCHSKYEYCLADLEKDWPKNIILPEVADYLAAERARCQAEGDCFPLHKYAHHGLSSQAMVFNLIGPLIVRNDYEPLRMALEAAGVEWPATVSRAEFEYEDRRVFNEDSGQPTSMDLVVHDGEGAPRIFIEAKLVEKEFGGCSVFWNGDCDGRNPAKDKDLCYLHFIGRRYWELLDKYGFLEGPVGSDSARLLSSYYQFFRELLFALELGGSFVLLSDERSPTFFTHGPKGDRGLIPFLLGLVPEHLRHHVAAVSVQDVVKTAARTGRHDDWVTEFAQKYGLESDLILGS
ncbi:MAG TPA: hypothetical protein VFE20_03420 [Thermoleophilia bacterium]|nr:hypothetical protein [Thermoleophilia bacterium]